MRTIILLVAWSLVGTALQAREWVSTDGRKLEAEFVSISGNRVTLKRASDGRNITVVLTLLSPADQAWIKARGTGASSSGPTLSTGTAKTYRCDFQTADWQTPWNMGNPNLPRNLAVVAEFPGRKSATEQALEVTLKQGTHYGADFGYDFASSGGAEPEEAYLTYKLCFALDFNAEAVQGGKLPGFGGVYGDSGSAGKKVDGSDSWSARGAYWKPDAQGRIPIGFYVYHPEMKGEYGDTWYFPQTLERGKWHEVGLYVKLNTPASTTGGRGLNDGILRAWLNGAPAYENREIRFRDTDRLKVRNVWFHFYHGGGAPASQDYKLWIDDVVIVRPE